MSDIVEKLKQTECQVDWTGPISLFHYSIAGNGYFDSFREIFEKNFSFVYLSYTNGIASAYLPSLEYQELGTHLAELARNGHFRAGWMEGFRESADKITDLRKKLTDSNFFEHSSHLSELYDIYTAYQVATKTASNFLTQESDLVLFAEFEQARKYSETLFQDTEKVIAQVFDRIVGKYEYSKAQLAMGKVDEIAAIARGDSSLSPEALQERFVRCGAYSSEKETVILDGKSAESIETAWFSSNSKSMKGTTAFAGIVRGTCRVIKDFKGADINEGEILVTGMTDPHFVPLMKKAAAIITDGGGLLCHAAIVARELKKPCVIGTKFATKILKDGTMVEVDAEKGIITVLS